MKKFWSEFREFAMRGSVIDMAVGVIIGGAFGKIVSSLVSDIVMPALSLITGKINLAKLAFVLPASSPGTDPISINYGNFLQTVLDFLVIAFAIFMAVKLVNRVHKKKEEAPPPEPGKEELLLTEIRDLLKEKNNG